MKNKFLKKLKIKFQAKEQEYKYYEENIYKEVQKLQSMNINATTQNSLVKTSFISNTDTDSTSDIKQSNNTQINHENLKKTLYYCQEFINELNNYNLNFYEKLKKVSFYASKWYPTITMVGEIIRNDFINLEKLRFTKPKLINFEKKLKNLNRLWNFNDEELFLTSLDDNKIIVLDNYFNVINEINEIDGIELNSPLGICSDNVENIYLCDYANQRVLIIDKEFKKIKKIFGKCGCGIGEFIDPLDVCFYSNSLYILDRELKRIQEFTRDGFFVREIKLYETITSKNIIHLNNTNNQTITSNSLCNLPTNINYNSKTLHENLSDRKLLTRPVRMCISNGIIAILDSFRKVLIYNLKGEFKQLIESNTNLLMCLVSDYLFTCNRDGLFICYQRNNNHAYNYGPEFIFTFERYIDCFKNSKSYMHYFDDNLVILLADNKSLAIL